MGDGWGLKVKKGSFIMNEKQFTISSAWQIILDNLSGSLSYEDTIFLKGYLEGYYSYMGTGDNICDDLFIKELLNFLVNK